MKISNTASAVRVTLSPTEISDLQFVIEAAERAGHYIPPPVPHNKAAGSRSAAQFRKKKAQKRAEKNSVTRIEQDRRARERQFMLGDRYSVMASRADYADASSDPDARQWVDLVFHEIMQRPLPDQYELRRDVWRVHVVQLDGGTLGAVVGGDCTQTADPAEITSVAGQLIARFEGRA
ncbi:hypothetical protein [Sphingomonas paucimobilis]|uniref:hypothetical protein n=1 Tax=Sphingomonas paucimobilis TaxID=13689 RepID=UPI0028D74308|nr:hypothetical protein [Sphingomonas paucimobilis]